MLPQIHPSPVGLSIQFGALALLLGNASTGKEVHRRLCQCTAVWPLLSFYFILFFFYFGRVFPCALRIRLKTSLASCEDGLKSGTYVQTGSPKRPFRFRFLPGGKGKVRFLDLGF